ncbi:MAG: hypothetical protein K1X74_18660 [Pirellulales bacterium]|nr:hypothetical protein [Pirellulales bacterium]
MTSRRKGAERGLLAALLLLLLANPVGLAQQPPESAPPLPPVSPTTVASPPGESQAVQPAPVAERQPSVFYLPDETGKLQPVLNFPLADFQELLALREAEAGSAARPKYSLELSIEGSEQPGHAALEIVAIVKAASEGWTRVALGMPGAALIDAPQYEGEGEFFLDYQRAAAPQEQDEGYVVWLRGDAAQIHRIAFSMRVAIARIGEESRLKLQLPQAEPARLRFQAAVAAAQTTLSTGAVLVDQTTNETGTLLDIAGLTPEFELAWRAPETQAAAVPAVLQASGTVQLSIDGRTVTSEALLAVSSLGNVPLQTIEIQLPPGADLITGPRQDYTVIEAGLGPGDVPLADTVQIKLPQPTPGPVEVRLITQRAYTPVTGENWLELAGFEVVGAARQTGFMTIQVVGDWQIVWGARRGVRQVETLPAELRKPELLAGFEYLSQPASLLARVVPRETRLAVEPEYIVLVDADRVRLEARLRYTVRGAKAFALDVEMPDWEIDEVGPASLVDLNGLVPEQRMPLSLPLLQPAVGELQLAVRAHRSLSPDTQQLQISLPRPRANAQGAATVYVLPADNVTLVERTASCVGLNRQAVTLPADLPRRSQEPLTYRGEPGDLVFAADYRVEPGRVRAQVTGQVELRDDGALIEQTLAYQIAYEPVESVIVLVPRAMVDSPALEFLLDDKPTKPTVLPGDELQDAGIARLRVPLGKPTIGSLNLRTRFSSSEDPLPSGTTVARGWPLVMPADDVFSRCELRVVTRPGLRALPRYDEWTNPPGAVLRRDELLLAAAKPVHELRMALSLEDRAPFGGTLVERAWIQSWHGPRDAQYRAAYLLASAEPEFILELPTGVPLASCEFAVDGRRVAPTVMADGRLQFALPAAADGRHRLEFDYRLPNGPKQPVLVAPRIAGGAWVRRMFWEVVLAPGTHLLQTPTGLYGEFRWAWQGAGWGRQPTLSTRQLEDWIGVEQRAALPPGAQRYLLSAAGMPDEASLATVERRTLLLLAAGPALALGLWMIYWSALRQPAMFLVLGIALACVAGLAPEPAVLFAQSALAGIALALVAALLRQWTLRRQRPPTLPRSRGGSSIVELGSTARQRASRSGVPSTTEPAPLPIAMQTSEQP